jgi:hypothetical protein
MKYLIFLLMLCSCSSVKYADRIKHNDIDQQVIQYRNSYTVAQRPMKLYNNKWNSPKTPLWYSLFHGKPFGKPIQGYSKRVSQNKHAQHHIQRSIKLKRHIPLWYKLTHLNNKYK